MVRKKSDLHRQNDCLLIFAVFPTMLTFVTIFNVNPERRYTGQYDHRSLLVSDLTPGLEARI